MPALNLNMKKAPSAIHEAGDYSDCPQHVYDALSIALATDEHRSKAQFEYRLVFCQKAKNSKGRKILATIKILSDKDKLLVSADVLVTIDYFFWIENPEKQEALLFHELCHIEVNEEAELIGVGHDIEEFYAVIKKYGDWNRQAQPIADSMKQFNLFEIEKGIASPA